MAADESKSEAPREEATPPSVEQGTATRPAPAKPATRELPPWKVLLHNDDVNDLLFVVETIVMLTPLGQQDAQVRTLEAHRAGIALLLTTHRERAELYQQQFSSRNLTVTIEPA